MRILKTMGVVVGVEEEVGLEDENIEAACFPYLSYYSLEKGTV